MYLSLGDLEYLLICYWLKEVLWSKVYSIFLTQYFPNLLNHEAEPMFSEHVRKPLTRWTRHEKAYIKKIMTLYFYNGQSCLTRTSSLCLLLINYMIFFCCCCWGKQNVLIVAVYALSLLNGVLSQGQASH